MNDPALFELVRRADPLPSALGEPPRELLDRVLGAPRAARTPRRVHAWQAKFALVAAVLGLSVAGASLAIAGTGWLVGTPAPADVKSDFGAYATQLGFDPQPGKAVLVASDGAYRLYATMNEQGGLCTLVSTPWNRPGADGEGGDCSANAPDAAAFWAGMGGLSSHGTATSPNSASTLVVDGHTSDRGAASVQFDAPNGATVTAPVGAGGFFVVGTTVPGSICDWGTWAPRFAVLDNSGRELSATSVTILPGPRRYTIPGRGQACVATVKPAFGASTGQLPLGG